jgi:hypothetical protein
VEDAELRRDLSKVADLRYGAIPETKAAIQRLVEQKRRQDEAAENSGETTTKMLSEKVGPDEVAMVVSR